MFIKFAAIFIMVIGLFATFLPKLPGTLIILAGAAVYGLATDFHTFTRPVVVVLLLLMAAAEIGGRVLRIALTRYFPISRAFSTNVAVGSLAGIISTGAMLGPLLGMGVWELISGKTLMPHWRRIQGILLRLLAIALFRFLCGFVMVIITISYILQ